MVAIFKFHMVATSNFIWCPYSKDNKATTIRFPNSKDDEAMAIIQR